MKRTYPTNVDGQIFYIDEDAFNLLQSYLHQLKETFKGTEGEEIVGDIESRIRELFNEKIRGGAGVIVLADVEKVIETMGRPEDLSDREETGSEENPDVSATSAVNDDESKSQQGESGSSKAFFTFSLPRNKRLYRNMKDKVFGGVIGGLAMYLGWNANIMRVLFLILAISTRIIPLTLIYLIAWMVIPPALNPRQILQMKGEPINVDTVGQTVISESPVTPPPINENANFISSFFSIVGKCILGFIALVSCVATFSGLIVFLVVLCGAVGFAMLDYPVILDGMNMLDNGWSFIWAVLCGSILWLIVFGSITWGCASSILNLTRMSKATALTLIICATMLFALVIILSIVAAM